MPAFGQTKALLPRFHQKCGRAIIWRIIFGIILPILRTGATMPFTVELEYTPRCPQPGMPFTEASFVRRSAPFEFGVGDIGIALVDLWNFGFADGPACEG